MGSGKSSTGASSYNYYGTIAAAICHGPITELYAVLCDGKAVWEDTEGLAASGDYTDLTSSVDPKFFATTGGYLRIYWGTATQTAPAALSGHPDYKNLAYLVASGFLFGNNKSTAPNIEVVCSRLPVCDTTLCAAGDNTLESGQANPVAILGELFTSLHGLSLPLSRLDATSWAAAAAYAKTNWSKTFCSPLLTAHADIRGVAATLLSMFDGALYWTTTGTLGLRLLKPGVNPGSLATLDAPLLTEKPRLRTGGWADVPTGFVVRYTDHDRKFKEADEKLDSLVALRTRLEDHRQTVELPHVTRRTQAVAILAELIRRAQHPATTLELSVRREHATSLTPGQKVMVDVEPEPGGAALAHLATVTERRDPGNGPVRLSLACDPIANSTPYSPTYTADEPQEADVDSIANALVVPLSVQMSGENAALAILAARPQDDCTGFEVHFSTDGSNFALLGRQEGFALRMTLDEALDDDETVITLTLTDGATGRDAYLAERTAGDEITALTDKLLLVIANVTDGIIDVDGDGNPELEFCSVVSRAAVDTDTHDYTVLRARKSTQPLAWTTDAQCWLIPGASLKTWTHESLLALLNTGNTGNVRLGAYTGYTVDASSPLPEFDFEFPSAYDALPAIAWTTPASSPSDLDSDGELDPAATITDADGNLVRVQLYSIAAVNGKQTNHFDVSVASTASITLADLFTLADVSGTIDFGTQGTEDQYFTLTIRATDAAGYVVESSRSLILPGSGGSGLGGITFTPEAGSFFGASLAVTLEAYGTNATTIHYALAMIGSAEPVSYTTVLDTTKNLTITSSRRIWARASDGANHSPWEFADYVRES